MKNNREIIRLLSECLASGDTQAWLQAHPDQRDALRPFLQLDASLHPAQRPEPSQQGFEEGRRLLLNAVAERQAQGRKPRWMASPVLRTASVLAAAVVAVGLAAGAAALSGHDFTDDVLSGLGVHSDGDSGVDASNASDRGLACASPNAADGRDNRDDEDNAADAAAKDGCEPEAGAAGGPSGNAAEKGDNADDGRGNASENASNAGDHPNENALQGSGNAADKQDNAGDHGPPE